MTCTTYKIADYEVYQNFISLNPECAVWLLYCCRGYCDRCEAGVSYPLKVTTLPVGLIVERSLKVRKVGCSIPGQARSKTEKHLLLPLLKFTITGIERDWLVHPVSVYYVWMVHYVYLRHGTSIYWNLKARLESAPVQQILHPMAYVHGVINHEEMTLNPVHLIN